VTLRIAEGGEQKLPAACFSEGKLNTRVDGAHMVHEQRRLRKVEQMCASLCCELHSKRLIDR
jgi:hypothetical protein